ncbi:hypothetical protein [Sphingomonas sp.]|uniref:hypothetical protein n=1 Tax=Sphingomonas sp. TaxID=28214 RepID=UPI003CC65048
MKGADALIARLLSDAAPLLADPDPGADMAVLFPVDMDPVDRHYRYGVAIDAELRLAGVGCDAGGGMLYAADDEADEDGEHETVFTVLEIDATDVGGARALMRLHLPDLGCPAGTLIHWGDDGEDRWDGERWHLDVPRSFEVED